MKSMLRNGFRGLFLYFKTLNYLLVGAYQYHNIVTKAGAVLYLVGSETLFSAMKERPAEIWGWDEEVTYGDYDSSSVSS